MAVQQRRNSKTKMCIRDRVCSSWMRMPCTGRTWKRGHRCICIKSVWTPLTAEMGMRIQSKLQSAVPHYACI